MSPLTQVCSTLSALTLTLEIKDDLDFISHLFIYYKCGFIISIVTFRINLTMNCCVTFINEETLTRLFDI